MARYSSEEAEREAVRMTAVLMAASARTAPKTRGEDSIKTLILDGEDIEKLAQNLFISPSTPAQHAALAAFTPATINILEARRSEFQQRRDFLAPALEALGFRIAAKPEGAFYLYVNCSELTCSSDRFARDLLDKAGVAATPGLDFGNNAPEEHLRFAYTTDVARLAEAVERIRRFLG